jgi:hypothetical protein
MAPVASTWMNHSAADLAPSFSILLRSSRSKMLLEDAHGTHVGTRRGAESKEEHFLEEICYSAPEPNNMTTVVGGESLMMSGG